jgi:hypothetical protein
MTRMIAKKKVGGGRRNKQNKQCEVNKRIQWSSIEKRKESKIIGDKKVCKNFL